MINQTSNQYDNIIEQCSNIFIKKNKDYGQSWRIMRVSSITDQIYIKATRIRTLELNGIGRIDEGIDSELKGIINYCIMALIQLSSTTELNIDDDVLTQKYNETVKATKDLMEHKNHDYGEVWRDMLVSTFTDMLLMRVHRIHQIIGNKGETIASEGVESNFMDMINYAIFALIRMEENNKGSN